MTVRNKAAKVKFKIFLVDGDHKTCKVPDPDVMAPRDLLFDWSIWEFTQGSPCHWFMHVPGSRCPRGCHQQPEALEGENPVLLLLLVGNIKSLHWGKE